jgi:hypothetical protein
MNICIYICQTWEGLPLDLLISFYSTFAGAFVLIMQTDKRSPPPRGEERVDPCLRAEGLKGARPLEGSNGWTPASGQRNNEDNEEHNLGKKSH